LTACDNGRDRLDIELRGDRQRALVDLADAVDSTGQAVERIAAELLQASHSSSTQSS
jgi:hypothetical protein